MPRPRINNQLAIRDLDMHLPRPARWDQHIMVPIDDQHRHAQLPEPIVRVLRVRNRPVRIRCGLAFRGLHVDEGVVVRLVGDAATVNSFPVGVGVGAAGGVVVEEGEGEAGFGFGGGDGGGEGGDWFGRGCFARPDDAADVGGGRGFGGAAASDDELAD